MDFNTSKEVNENSSNKGSFSYRIEADLSSKAKHLEILKKFSETASIAGLVYLSKEGYTQREKAFWILIIISFVGLSLGWSLHLYHDWIENPIQTNIASKYTFQYSN